MKSRGAHRAGRPGAQTVADIAARVVEEPPRTWPVGAIGMWNIMNDGSLQSRLPIRIYVPNHPEPTPAYLVAPDPQGAISDLPASFFEADD